MALESSTYIAGLNTSNPVGGSDPKSQGDDHLKLIKSVLKNTFPDADKEIRIQQAREDIASATTCDIGAATTDYVNITGTTTITGFGTVAAGTTRKIRFNAALILTYHATALILPGAADITTAAGDHAFATSLGGGNWVVEVFQRFSGKSLIAPSAADITSPFLELFNALMVGISFEWNGALADIPDRFLPCDGRLLSRSTYSALYGKIGILHDAGNGTTTFGIPDDRGVVVAGLDNMGTAAGAAGVVLATEADTVGAYHPDGEETHTLTIDEMPEHHHTEEGFAPSGTVGSGPFALSGSEEAGRNTGDTGGDEPHNNMQPTQFKLKIIYTGVSTL